MSAIDNTEVTEPVGREGPSGSGQKPVKKTIHFSDGSTMEVEDDAGAGRGRHNLLEPEEVRSSQRPRTGSSDSEPSVDPSKLSWSDWMKHYSHRGTTSVMNGLENTGETLAYYLGITAPKYQMEIDEYNRMITKKKEAAREAEAWSSGPQVSTAVVMEQVKPKLFDISASADDRSSRENDCATDSKV